MFRNSILLTILSIIVSTTQAAIVIPDCADQGYLELAAKAGRCSVIRISLKNPQDADQLKLMSFRVSLNDEDTPQFELLGQTILNDPIKLKYDWAGTGQTAYRLYVARKNGDSYNLVNWSDALIVEPIIFDDLCFKQWGVSYKPFSMSINFTGIYIGVGVAALIAAAGIGGYIYHKRALKKERTTHSGLQETFDTAKSSADKRLRECATQADNIISGLQNQLDISQATIVYERLWNDWKISGNDQARLNNMKLDLINKPQKYPLTENQYNYLLNAIRTQLGEDLPVEEIEQVEE